MTQLQAYSEHYKDFNNLPPALLPFKKDLEARQGKKVGELDTNELSQLITLLIEITAIKGDNKPDGVGIRIIADYLLFRCKNWHAAEVKRAFYQSLGKANHYHKFSAEYMAQVINEYEEQRQKVNKTLVNEPLKEIKPRELHPKEIIKNIKETGKTNSYYGQGFNLLKYLEAEGDLYVDNDIKKHIYHVFEAIKVVEARTSKAFQRSEFIKRNQKNAIIVECCHFILDNYFYEFTGAKKELLKDAIRRVEKSSVPPSLYYGKK